MALTQDRQSTIARMLRAGATHRQIAEELGCSTPNVTQIVARYPALRRLRSQRTQSALGKLRVYRQELIEVDAEVRVLGRRIRRAIRDLEEEIEIGEIDH
jgi:DNA-binding CsgD family transcriptional regulator